MLQKDLRQYCFSRQVPYLLGEDSKICLPDLKMTAIASENNNQLHKLVNKNCIKF